MTALPAPERAVVDPMVAAAVSLFGAEVIRPLLPPRPPPRLRQYQGDAVARLEAALADGKKPLLVAPTGSGKTVILSELIRRRVGRGARVVFLTPRRELVTQTCAKLDDVGVEHGVLLAGADERAGLGAAVQVAGVDTLVSRVKKRRTLALPKFDLAIVDEAHLSITRIRTELVTDLAAAVVGATATPTRKDGRALGLLYDTIVEPATTEELTAAGYLVPARYWSWPTPDLHGVRVVAGDYNPQDLEAVMSRAPLLADVVTTWLQRAADRRTVVFCTGIAHAVALAEAFRRVGVAAEHVDARTPASGRAATFQRFSTGATQVMTNCFLAAYGFDLPMLSCVVLARPTKSLMLYLQMLGRGLRIAPDKRDCLVLDHAGCVHRHGFATDLRAWTLDGEYALEPAATRARPERAAKECPECHAVWTGSPRCPECGHELRPAGRMVPTLDGQLVEVGSDLHRRDLTRRDVLRETAERRQFFTELRSIGASRGYRPAWAAVNYHERYSDWPPREWNADTPAPPSRITQRWVRSRLIAYAKAKAREQEQRA